MNVPTCLAFSIVLVAMGCEERGTPSSSAKSEQDKSLVDVIFRTPSDPNDVMRILWEKTCPGEYKALHARRDGFDPFAEFPNTPEEKLTPGDFGLLDWDRGMIPRAFDDLGYPLKKGTVALYDHNKGRLRISHSRQAIAAFRARFPEFQIISEQAGTYDGG